MLNGFGRVAIQFAQVTDGLSNTLMVGERPPPDSLQAGRWYTGSRPPGRRHNGPDQYMLVDELYYKQDMECARAGFFPSFRPGTTGNACHRYHFWSLHPGGANFVFADGSARYLSYSAAPIMRALASRAGGKAVSVP